MELTLKQVEQATGGRLYGADAAVATVVIDSREVVPGALYVAIAGDRFDGHDFCAAAIENGAAALVCSREVSVDVPYVLVKDTRQALLDIAGFYRASLPQLQVVGLTGSVGKTTTKEMTYAVLAQKYKAIKTEGNLNNEIGMPKTLFRLQNDTQAAVIEMGMSDFGEIARMTVAARPDVGVITNIGVSHIAYLGSRDGILKAKTELLLGMPKGAPLLLNGDDDKLSSFTSKDYDIRLFAIDNPKAAVRATHISEENGQTHFTVQFAGGTQPVTIPTIGRHNVYDALAAFGVGLSLAVEPAQIAAGLLNYVPAGMRQRIRTVGDITVVEDCYNASPDSQRAALEVLSALPAQRKIAVLGDMLELGDYADEAHRQVGQYAAAQSVDLLFGCGTYAKSIVEAASKTIPAQHFETKEALFAALLQEIQPGDAVLFKASRGMAFEDVMQKLYEEWKEK